MVARVGIDLPCLRREVESRHHQALIVNAPLFQPNGTDSLSQGEKHMSDEAIHLLENHPEGFLAKTTIAQESVHVPHPDFQPMLLAVSHQYHLDVPHRLCIRIEW